MKCKFLVIILSSLIILVYCKKSSNTEIISDTQQNRVQTNEQNKPKIIYKDDIPIVNAVRNDELLDVKNLLIEGVSANSKNKYGTPILILAAYHGYSEIVKQLLANGAEIDAVDKDGDSALHNAVYKNNDEVTKILLIYGADKSLKNKKGKTARDIAKEKNFTSIIELFDDKYKFIKKRRDLHILIRAIKNNEENLVKQILSNNIVINYIPDEGIIDYGMTYHELRPNTASAFLIAVQYSTIDIINLLLKYGADINYVTTGPTALSPIIHSAMDIALQRGNVEIVKFLIKNKISKQVCLQALENAILSNNIEIENLLLNYGVPDPSKKIKDGKYFNFLSRAVEGGNIRVIQKMLENGMDINIKLYSPCGVHYWSMLISAISGKKVELIKFLINRGVDVNYNSSNKVSPLMIAASQGDISTLKILIQKGANVNAKDNDNKTALDYAKEKGHHKIVKILLKAGARE